MLPDRLTLFIQTPPCALFDKDVGMIDGALQRAHTFEVPRAVN